MNLSPNIRSFSGLPDDDIGSTPKKYKSSRAVQTFFRNIYRSHNSLSALADRKANIMIRLNSLLISLLIVFYGNIAELNSLAVVAVAILLLTTLISLIFAAFAARPDVTHQKKIQTNREAAMKNMAFFGNFVQLDLEVYEEMMKELLENPSLIYRNMSRDLYFLGKVLDKKFRQLSFSYNAFIIGFLLSVIIFVIGIFI